MAAKKKMNPKFPAVVYVTLETEKDGSTYLVAHEDIDSIPDSEDVGVYGLNRVGTMVVTRELDTK